MTSSGQSSRKFARIKYEPITIKEPHKYDVKTFEDSDEFTAYYREHEDDFKGVSTLVLNRTYKIPGYRISVSNRGKENEELTLRKDYSHTQAPASASADTSANDLSELIARIENIEKFLEQLQD